MTCKNCGQAFEGKYCNYCGQSAAVKRVDFAYLLLELKEKVFQVEHGFLFTMKALTISPGKSIKSFLEGKRKPFFKPFAYLLVLSAIYVLLAQVIGKPTYLGDALAGYNNYEGANHQGDLAYVLIDWMAQHFTYTNLLLIPLYAFSTFLLFRKSGYNFFEHLVLNVYISAQLLLAYIFFYLIFYFLEDVYYLEIVPSIIGFAYTLWVFIGFFSKRKIIHVSLRLILSYFIYLFLLAFFFSLPFLLKGLYN